MRGLKHDVHLYGDGSIEGRIPHGMRGLKLLIDGEEKPFDPRSHPAWDAWIETFETIHSDLSRKSHPAWDAWIETRSRIQDQRD